METLNIAEYQQVAQGRGVLYGTLSSIFLREISLDFLNFLRGEDIRPILEEMGFDAQVLYSERKDENFIETLKWEYAALFVGPMGPLASPFESVYFEKRICGDAAERVKRFYARCGLSLPSEVGLGEFKVLPDHIGVELYFMKLLVEKEREAWEKGDCEEAGKATQIQKEFLEEHPGQWISLFSEKANGIAAKSLYAEFAKLAETFIHNDLEELISVSNLKAGSGEK